ADVYVASDNLGRGAAVTITANALDAPEATVDLSVANRCQVALHGGGGGGVVNTSDAPADGALR
ncbi:MAG: hypothetical protein ACYCUG_06140, partial [Acidimicrobiales bacterium]